MGKFKSMAIIALMALMTSGGVRAESITLVAGTDPTIPSSFTLDFGAFGRSTGHISFMDIELEVDPDAGTAQFVRYYQEVAPLTLPGDLSTGNLIMEIGAGSSSGTYNELTGIVDTVDEYAIHFDGDLSAYGLVSPSSFRALPSEPYGLQPLTAEPLRWTGLVLESSPIRLTPATR